MVTFKLFAGTHIGLRDNNEDNFTVCPDLTRDEWMVPDTLQHAIPLGERGSLVVVADGMGGMNAGEVASDIAIKTVQQLFAPAVLSSNLTNKSDSIKTYLKKAIVLADEQIKAHCLKDPSTEGMGSTIVIVWLYKTKAYIAWLGDSRAYSFLPDKGIKRLSKDHSYVQELVDAKLVTEEEAMIHPKSNVITRSLGDTTQKAKPEVVCRDVQKGEIILVCTDGLCGVCHDAEIEAIIQQQQTDLQLCKEELTKAALQAGGSDNITIALLQIDSISTKHEKGLHKPSLGLIQSWKDVLLIVFALFLLAALCFAGIRSCDFTSNTTDSEQTDTCTAIAPIDTIRVDTTKKVTKSRHGATSAPSKSMLREIKQKLHDKPTPPKINEDSKHNSLTPSNAEAPSSVTSGKSAEETANSND